MRVTLGWRMTRASLPPSCGRASALLADLPTEGDETDWPTWWGMDQTERRRLTPSSRSRASLPPKPGTFPAGIGCQFAGRSQHV